MRTPGYGGLQGFAELVIQNKIKLKFFSAKLVIGFLKFRYALTPGHGAMRSIARTGWGFAKLQCPDRMSGLKFLKVKI